MSEKEVTSATTRKNNPKWTTNENLVLLKGWIKIKYGGKNGVVSRNPKGEACWGKIADYCNEHCSFDPPRDKGVCKNHYNYINKLLGKWIDAYDNAKGMQQNGWSENDILAKANELYESGNNGKFTLMSEWHVVRDQPCYVSQVMSQVRGKSQVGGNTGSGSSGSKRAREIDVGDLNSIGSMPRPMGRESSKKKGKKKDKGEEVVNEKWIEFKQFKEKDWERLDEVIKQQQETNKLMKDKLQAKQMKLWMKLSAKEQLDDKSKQIFEMLGVELFGK